MSRLDEMFSIICKCLNAEPDLVRSASRKMYLADARCIFAYHAIEEWYRPAEVYRYLNQSNRAVTTYLEKYKDLTSIGDVHFTRKVNEVKEALDLWRKRKKKQRACKA